MLPFSWMYRDPAEVAERMEEQITPQLKQAAELELRNKRRRIRKLAKARKLKGQR